MFENTKYIFSGSCDDKTHLYAPDRYDTSDVIAKEIEDLFKHPEQIKPLPRWTPEEQKMAEKDRFRFGWVARDGDSLLYLYVNKPKKDPRLRDGIEFFDGCFECFQGDYSNYPSLQPGECVSLKEIAGGGE